MAQEIEVLDPEQFPSVTEEPLSPAEQDVLAHWQRFQPTLCRQLRAQGPNVLETAVRKAWYRNEYQIALTLSRKPDLHRIQVEAMFREQLWLPPEPSLTPDPRRPTTA